MQHLVVRRKSEMPAVGVTCPMSNVKSDVIAQSGVVLTTFVTITGHCPAYFCALLSASNDNLSMSPGLIDKLVNDCYMTILSLSLGIIYKLSLNHGTIHNLVIEP